MIRLRGPAVHLCIVLTASAVLMSTIDTADATERDAAASARATFEEPASPADPAAYASGLIVRTTDGVVTTKLLTRVDALTPAEVAGSTPVATGADTIDLTAPVTLESAETLARRVEEQPGVVSAEPNRIVRLRSNPPVARTDPYFRAGRQRNVWDRRSSFDIATGKARLPTGGYSTRAPYLWRATSGAGAVVAVIDTGITAHPDLRGRTVQGYDFYSDKDFGTQDRDMTSGFPNKQGRDADPSDPGDWIPDAGYCDLPGDGGSQPSSWHGTHVAGIIAATPNNRIGITGIAARSKVQPIRVLGPCGGDESDIANAIVWASGGPVAGVPANRTPAKVINLSLGVSDTRCGSTFGSAIRAARSRGAVVVVAAGNDSTLIDDQYTPAPVAAPATCDGVISVAASDEVGQRAVYSNVGRRNNLAAPGGNSHWKGFSGIVSTVNRGTTGPLTSPAPGYRVYEGTSMAAPAVSAGAALMSSLGYRRTEIERALRHAVQPFPRYRRYASLDCTTSTCGRGVLDLAKVPAPYGTTKIRGSASPGRTIKVSTRWTGSPRLSYQWFRGGRAIKKAHSSSYRVRSSDRGRTLTVRVTGRKSGFKTFARVSAGRRAR